MKSSKSEIFYLILSIITLIAGFIIYRTYGNRHTLTSQNASIHQSAEKTEKSTTNKAEKEAEDRVKESESKTTANSVSIAQEALDKLTDGDKKTDLQNRLDNLKAEVDNQIAAEQALVNAEGYQVQYNADLAQSAINLITNQEVKEGLQVRLNTVTANIQAQTTAYVAAVAATPVEVVPSQPDVVYYE